MYRQILKQRIVERSLTAFIRYHIETNGKQPIQNAQLDVTLSPRQSHNPLLKLIWPVFDRDTTRRTRIRDNAPHFVTVLLLVKVPIQQEDWGLHQIITFNYNNPFFVAKVYYDSCIEPKLCSFHEKYPEYSNPAKLVKEGWLAYSMVLIKIVVFPIITSHINKLQMFTARSFRRRRKFSYESKE